ncbi:MAG: PDZ domain-containing protein [Gammaproteobacteria bacterium]|nr:PDZ domain-containing protein [Gammaproteobacteria bacterium]
MNKMKIRNYLVVLAFAMSAFSVSGQAQEATQPAEPSDDASTSVVTSKSSPKAGLPLSEIKMFSEVFERIRTEYVDEVDEATLIKNAIRGMLDGLDPHSSFLAPEDYDDLVDTSEGKFGGLGVEIMMEGELLKVISPIDDTPASLAGIEPGDVIVMIDGEPVQGLDLRQSVDRMRGEPGTEVELTIFREGEEAPLKMTLIRANIKMSSVKSEFLAPGFAYARVSSFQQNSAQNLRFKVKKMASDGKVELKGLVLDLRNNPGGNLDSAIEISDMFLRSGEIVSTRGRKPDSVSSFQAKPDDILNGLPMVVLVNSGSASASEIVAGALQDHSRALIVGNKTFGKGSVQVGVRMANGAGLKLTTARYYTPSGRSIQATGITPDVVVRAVEYLESDDAGRRMGEKDLVGHLENDSNVNDSNADDVEPSEGKPTNQSSVLLERDHGLNVALNILKGMSLVTVGEEE